jgi:hypothetical protein
MCGYVRQGYINKSYEDIKQEIIDYLEKAGRRTVYVSETING